MTFYINISYNCLNSIEFNNTLFIIDCFIYTLLYLNSSFLEQKFDVECDREYVKMLWNYLSPNEFYIYIYRNDNFIALNKLSWKYRNAFYNINSFILKKHNFVWLKKFFEKNAFLYWYISFQNTSVEQMIVV